MDYTLISASLLIPLALLAYVSASRYFLAGKKKRDSDQAKKKVRRLSTAETAVTDVAEAKRKNQKPAFGKRQRTKPEVVRKMFGWSW